MIDLHMHSTFSDGSYTPEELVEEGVKQGLTAIALTDHDSTNGIPRFLAAAEGKPIRTISGVEVSADFRRGTMHMLGYGIHHEERELNEHLKWIRSGRESRNQEILHLLNKLGFHITWHEVQSYAGEDVVGRPHFAAAMVEKGYVASRQEAFDRYLGKGKPAYAERRRLSPSDTIRLIRGAGGVPVLAHPFTLNLGRSDLRKLIGELTREGLLGIEVFYSEHTARMQKEYLSLARHHKLITTGGTDFHGALTPDLTLGRGFGALHVPDEVVDKMDALRLALDEQMNS